MTLPTVVAFSWGPDHFHESAMKMQARCKQLGIPHRIRVRADLDDHWLACPDLDNWAKKRWCYRYIPTLILEELDAGEEDVLYLHADYRIRRTFPAEAFEDLDVGLQRRWAWRVKRAAMPALAAPVYARNNERSRRFLRHWRSRCMELDDGGGEHGPLWETWQLFQRWDRSLRLDYFHVNVASQAANVDCPIVGHKKEKDKE